MLQFGRFLFLSRPNCCVLRIFSRRKKIGEKRIDAASTYVLWLPQSKGGRGRKKLFWNHGPDFSGQKRRIRATAVWDVADSINRDWLYRMLACVRVARVNRVSREWVSSSKNRACKKEGKTSSIQTHRAFLCGLPFFPSNKFPSKLNASGSW